MDRWGTHEQRLTIRLHLYWDSLRKDRPIPDIRHFAPEAIDDLWPHCFQVSLASHGKHTDYKFEYMGDALAKLYGRDLTGQVMAERIPDFPGMVIQKKLDTVARNAVHMHDDGNFLTKNNKLIKYRACLLPFHSGGDKVSHVIVGVAYRAF